MKGKFRYIGPKVFLLVLPKLSGIEVLMIDLNFRKDDPFDIGYQEAGGFARFAGSD